MTVARAALIVGGYAAACAAGAAAVWLHDRTLSAADQLAMSGMLAFGDTVLFCAVAAPVAIVPTVALFGAIGRAPRFWRAYAVTSLLLAITGIVEAVMFLLPMNTHVALLEGLRRVSPLRVLAGPVFFAGYTPGLLPVAAPNRRLTVLACMFELCTMASFVVWLAWQTARNS
jgi:hypothetical protein